MAFGEQQRKTLKLQEMAFFCLQQKQKKTETKTKLNFICNLHTILCKSCVLLKALWTSCFQQSTASVDYR